MGQSFDHRFHHSSCCRDRRPAQRPRRQPAHGEWMLTTETSLHGRRSMVKAPSWRRLGSAQLAPVPKGRGRGASTPRARGRPRAPSHRQVREPAAWRAADAPPSGASGGAPSASGSCSHECAGRRRVVCTGAALRAARAARSVENLYEQYTVHAAVESHARGAPAARRGGRSGQARPASASSLRGARRPCDRPACRPTTPRLPPPSGGGAAGQPPAAASVELSGCAPTRTSPPPLRPRHARAPTLALAQARA